MGYPNTPAAFDGYVWNTGPRLMALSPNGHAGPATYVKSTTTGDVLQASEFGMKFLERVEGGITSNGTYTVRPVNPIGPAATVKLIWFDNATGLEVAAGVNLSASTVNLVALGR